MHCVVHDLEGSFPLAEAYLRSMINGNYRSLIDLCCCHAQLTGVLGFEKRRYLDVIERTLAHPSEQNFFVQTDVLKEHELFNEHWDVATCLDGIEHVTKEQGLLLRDRMVAIADLSIIFTPADPWCMSSPGDDKWENPESHKSVWSADDFPGWATITLKRYHPTLGIGAFFSWYNKNVDMKSDFERVVQELGLCQA